MENKLYRRGGIDITKLKYKSIYIITTNQQASGSYVASPNFSTYNYCWLRDGSFSAYSMDLYKKFNSSNRFFDWTNIVICRQEDKLKRILRMKTRGDILLNDDYLPTWFTLDGNECDQEWPNYQLDGYGVWLWALAQHFKITKNDNIMIKYKQSIAIAVEYLCNFWNYPCFDCWQENGETIHTATLASIYGGLNSINEYLNNSHTEKILKEIKQYVLDNNIEDGRLKKSIDVASIDASLLWTVIPFKLFEVNDLIIKKTINMIEHELVHQSGVQRYPKDTYYGGGEWIILSAWLGLYYCEVNEIDKARETLKWIESKANKSGELAEQILDNISDDSYINKWKSLWGEVASPVLWAHAMYLILLYNVKKLSL
ncbi:MAG: glycoside hydrolase family 15 protein [Clostridiaceae bacterium]